MASLVVAIFTLIATIVMPIVTKRKEEKSSTREVEKTETSIIDSEKSAEAKQSEKPIGKYSNYMELGLAASSEGKYDQAIEYYEKAIELKRNYVYAWVSKGSALRKLGGRDDEVLEAYEKAIESKSENDPDSAWIWNLKGYALRRLDRDNEAIKAFEKAIELKPNAADGAWMGKGYAFRKLGRKSKADESFKKAKELRSQVKECVVRATYSSKSL